ncbi:MULTISPECIES: hypothetical protein [Nocardia]|uniref:hypothetical protein n=1 Tax=Nocardia TaxID=1817 RepID=UPI00245509E9|nr:MULTISPECIES: hypothetical protein [Nocardia]
MSAGSLERKQAAARRSVARAARAAYDQARAELFATIRAALDDGVGPSAIARYSDFTREYIARIRDGKGPKEIRG